MSWNCGGGMELVTDKVTSATGRGCVKTHFARRVGSITGEFDVMSCLTLPVRGLN
jgi:hypothetical protein